MGDVQDPGLKIESGLEWLLFGGNPNLLASDWLKWNGDDILGMR